MAPKIKEPPKLTALPLLPQENLYVGVDIGKFRQYSGHATRQSLEIYSKLSLTDAQRPYNQAMEHFPIQ